MGIATLRLNSFQPPSMMSPFYKEASSEGAVDMLEYGTSTLTTEHRLVDASPKEDASMKYTGVHQRSKNSWYIKLTFIDPDTNEQIRCTHSKGYKTAEEAYKARCKYQEQINVMGVPTFYSAKQADEGNSIITAAMTIKEYMTYWFETIHKPSVSVQTATGDESDIRLHIAPALGQKKLGKLTKRDISDMCENMRLGREDGGKGLKCRTADRVLTTISSALKYAVEQGAIKDNVAMGVMIRPDEEAFKPILLNREQLQRLIAVSKDYSNGIGFEIQSKAGLRSAEVRGLKFSDIDFKKGTLQVQRQVIAIRARNKAEYIVTSKLKTTSSRRTIPVPTELLTSIQAHRASIEANKRIYGDQYRDNDFIVCDKYGCCLKPRPYYDAFKRILKRAKLPDMRNHDLRHVFATMCAEGGMPEKVLANILGHASTAMVQQYYVGNIDGNNIAANTINNVFSGF